MRDIHNNLSSVVVGLMIAVLKLNAARTFFPHNLFPFFSSPSLFTFSRSAESKQTPTLSFPSTPSPSYYCFFPVSHVKHMHSSISCSIHHSFTAIQTNKFISSFPFMLPPFTPKTFMNFQLSALPWLFFLTRGLSLRFNSDNYTLS